MIDTLISGVPIVVAILELVGISVILFGSAYALVSYVQPLRRRQKFTLSAAAA